MKASAARRAWEAGRCALSTTVHSTDPAFCELASSMGWDVLWIDCEHHATDLNQLSHMIRAAAAGGAADIMARPARGEFMRLGRMLEIGATGILYPRCEDAEEAAEAARWCRFPPLGDRGMDGGNRDNGYCGGKAADYVAEANTTVFLGVQIETPRALEQAEAIAAVPGVDLVFFGPGDYSLQIGRPGEVQHAEVQAACDRVCVAAKSAGKRFGTPCLSDEHGRHLRTIGCDLLCMGSDIGVLRTHWQESLAKLRE